MHAANIAATHISAGISAQNWQLIDDKIIALASKKGELELEIGRWLVAALRARVDRALGFGSFAEYVERRLGYDARTLKEKLRVAQSLEELPNLRASLETGARSWSAVREISRVATRETEQAWIAATERRTVREIETMVAGRKTGELPSDPKDPLLTTHRLVFELEAENFALVTRAFEQIRAQIGAGAGNADVLVALAEVALGARPADKSSYQTALTMCVACDRTWMQAGSKSIEVLPANAECARCDGELIGFARAEEGVTETQDAAARAQQSETEQKIAADPKLGARGMLKLAARVFGVPLRSITPKLRQAVRARDGNRCAVPGCTNFRFLDIHHHPAKSKGGQNKLDLLHTLCTRHHRAVHEGLLSIEGSPSGGYVVRHAGGTLYGAPRSSEATHVGPGWCETRRTDELCSRAISGTV